MRAGLAEVSNVAVFGLPGRPSAAAWRKGSGFAMLPEKLVQRWEYAYHRYGLAVAVEAASAAGDRDAAREMAASSWEVAAAWREMESTAGMPWWALAALSAAAQSFEFQARDWNARASHGWPADRERRTRPEPQMPTSRPPCGPVEAEG